MNGNPSIPFAPIPTPTAQPAEVDPGNRGSNEAPHFRRTYKACVPCREKKVKCYLGAPDKPAQPPCLRCRRSGRACFFDDKTRGGRRERKRPLEDPEIPSQRERSKSILTPPAIASHESLTTAAIYAPPPNEDQFILQHPAAPMLNEDDPLALSELRNSGDAFNILAAAAAKSSPTRRPPGVSPYSTSSDQLPKDAKTVWSKCIFVQMKILTRTEAIELVNFFYTSMSSVCPFVWPLYANPEKHEELVNHDTILLGAIITASSRHHLVSGIDGWSRSNSIHDRCWNWTKNALSSVVFGGKSLQNAGFGVVEACLILSEWAPKSVMEDDGDDDRKSVMSEDENEHEENKRDLKVALEGAYRTDRFSWMMTGTAYTLVQHLLHLTSTSETAEFERIRSNLFYCYLMITNLSRRLGQNSMISMEVIDAERQFRPAVKASTINAFLNEDHFFELLKILHSAQVIFYPDQETTRKLVEEGRHIYLFRWFQSIIRTWKAQLPPVGPDSFGTIQLEIDHEYLLLYVYSLSLQAIVLSRTHNASKIIPRPPADRQILATADQEFVLLAVDAAKNVIRLVTQEITKFVSASYLSARYFCKVVFSASFLIKVMYIGGVDPSMYPSLIALLDQTIQRLQSAALDDVHPALRYAYIVKILLQNIRTKIQMSRRASPSVHLAAVEGDDIWLQPGDPLEGLDIGEAISSLVVDGNHFNFADMGTWEELFNGTGFEDLIP